MRVWWCGVYKEYSNRPTWRWAGMKESICPICMDPVSACKGMWRQLSAIREA